MTTCDELLKTARLIEQVERTPSENTAGLKPAVAAASVKPAVEDASVHQMAQMLTAMEELTQKVSEVMSTRVAGIQHPRGAAGNITRGPARGFRGSCYRCGESGHMARDCRKAAAVCGICGNPGHKDDDCALRRRSDGCCRLCGNVGHSAERCALKNRKLILN